MAATQNLGNEDFTAILLISFLRGSILLDRVLEKSLEAFFQDDESIINLRDFICKYYLRKAHFIVVQRDWKLQKFVSQAIRDLS